MQSTAIEIWVYGVLMMMGGVIGFVKVGSKASLISGVGLGLALVACGFGVWYGYYNSIIVAEVIATLLVVLFAIRFAKTGRFMPAGMLAILSVVAVVVFWLGLKR